MKKSAMEKLRRKGRIYRLFTAFAGMSASCLWYDNPTMKARSAARELALLALFQLEKQGQIQPGQKFPRKDLEDLILDAVRALVDQADEQIHTAAQDLAAVSRYLLETELDHPTNLESPLDEPSRPVPIPTTREMIEQIETLLQGAENLAEALRIPELATHAHAQQVRDYAIRLIELITEHQVEVDAWIESCSEDWKVTRLVKIDRDILRMAAVELKFLEGVDTSVSIDEAVELAKKFSTEESFRFINGVLGKMAEQVPPKTSPQEAPPEVSRGASNV
jgi:transcription antitermination protein NusB